RRPPKCLNLDIVENAITWDAAVRSHAADHRTAEIIGLPLKPMKNDFQNTARIAGHPRSALVADLFEQARDFAAPDTFDRTQAELGIDQPFEDRPALADRS